MIQTRIGTVAAGTVTGAEPTFFLSELVRSKIFIKGKKVGSLTDIVIKENGALPVVTFLYVALPFGEKALVPWEHVGQITHEQIALNIDDIQTLRGEPDDSAVLLRDYILDKKAIDMDGRELEVVYDVRLVLRNNKLYVSDVDFSRYGLLRRLHLARLADFIYNLAENIRDQTVSWKYVQPLPSDLGRFKGKVKLNVLKEKLDEMHPADLADILEELDPDQRVEVFEKLDPEQASDTLEEIDPNTQRDLVESLKIDRVAVLVDDMTTGQAADFLAVLSSSEADAILEKLNPGNAKKIRAIIEEHEHNILDFATQDFIMFPPDKRVEQAQDEFRTVAKGKDVVMYLYILDPERRLLGVLDIKELLMADDQALLKDVMVENVVALETDDTLKKASELFAHYQFRALPVTDKENKLYGVVTYRDIMGLSHRYVE